MDVLHGLDRLVTSAAGRRIGQAWRGMLNLIVPNPCALCVWEDAQQNQLCELCTSLLKQLTHQVIQAQDFANALPLDLVTGQPLRVFAASLYTPEMAKLVLNYKDHQRIKLAGALRPIMYRTLRYAAQYCGAPAYRLVPIPASSASMRRRGYNPVTMMLPSTMPQRVKNDPGLVKTRWQMFRHAAHHGTGIQARRAAAQKQFRLAARYREPAEPIILVDDVLTTGATLAAATRLLQSQGFDVVGAVVLSAVMPRS